MNHAVNWLIGNRPVMAMSEKNESMVCRVCGRRFDSLNETVNYFTGDIEQTLCDECYRKVMSMRRGMNDLRLLRQALQA